ncbi:hypothetical protein L2750_07310 [Shewanella submarina]|uniref:DUF6776 family protein n=1 Tax=Shewanella submarina TaxID=2016376 RepID=A0ABV7GAF3_9GAMM|nr:DUF6776 family protein [Shewanella submarina]MCL1036960.1 hypothetical protein [Shewanella submarina]
MSNYHRWADRLQGAERRYRASSLYLLLLVLVAFVLGGLSHYFWSAEHTRPVVSQDGEIARLETELQARASELASRNLELVVAKEANDNMQKMFNDQLVREKQLQRELNFYRSVMAPENNAEGVAIYSAELLPGVETGKQRLELTLMQLEKRKQLVKGRVEVSLIGTEDGVARTIPLKTLTGNTPAFNFRYFQMLESEFALPEGFNLARVNVKVVVPASRWTKGAESEQTFSVPELTSGEKEPRVILEQNSQVTDNPAQQTDVRGSND